MSLLSWNADPGNYFKFFSKNILCNRLLIQNNRFNFDTETLTTEMFSTLFRIY